VSVLPLEEVRHRLRPRLATIFGGFLGAAYGLSAHCPDGALLVTIVLGLFSALGLLGDAPDSWRDTWRSTREGDGHASRFWFFRVLGPSVAWAAIWIAATAIPRLVVHGRCGNLDIGCGI
jgi:hypothetical protein